MGAWDWWITGRKVTWSPESKRIFAVSSTGGPGVAEHMFERLFEPFFTTKEHGLGLGLSISRSLVSAHGGRLEGHNNPDCGVTFSFTLPVEQ